MKRFGFFASSLTSLVVMFLVVFTLEASARTFVVRSADDQADIAPGDGFCIAGNGLCTLRAALQEANAFTGPDEVVLKGALYQLGLSGDDDTGAAGDLDITGDLFLRGRKRGGSLIDGRQLDRVFDVHGATVTFLGITVRNGKAETGGGIRNDGGTVRLKRCTVGGNQATLDGGGIRSSDGRLILSGSRVVGNFVLCNSPITAMGGGILVSGGTLTMKKSIVRGNELHAFNFAGRGGGVYADSVDVTVRASIVDANTVVTYSASGSTAGGGGLYVRDGSLAIVSSRLDANMAISYQWDAYGGALDAVGPPVRIEGTSFSGNRVSGVGNVRGGAAWIRDCVDIAGSTFTGNRVNAVQFALGGAIGMELNDASCPNRIAHTTVTGNTAIATQTARGGGIFINSGISEGVPGTFAGVKIIGNTAAGQSAEGGGVLSAVVLVIKGQSVVRGNSASGSVQGRGGGLSISAPLTLAGGSRVTGNVASHDGGGSYRAGSAPVTLVGSKTKIAGNSPDDIEPQLP